MQHFCNSWRAWNLLVRVLMHNKSLKLAESIMSLYPHQPAQAQHEVSSPPTVNTPRLACLQQYQRRPVSIPPNLDTK
jgi:hypothetical protein